MEAEGAVKVLHEVGGQPPQDLPEPFDGYRTHLLGPRLGVDAHAGEIREEQLLRRRIVLLSGRIDPATAQSAAARLMLADADGTEPIQLQVNCPDADLAGAVMLTETIQLVRARVIATASGVVGGPAVAVYAAARHRRAHPHARFALFEPSTSIAGPAGRMAAEAAVHRDRLDFLTGVIAAATGSETVAEDVRARRTLTAAEARAYGLVDEVVATT